ncbi:DUF3558 domain-containing protein [Nocardia canadensis]|jgi:hypothetical protein|uniref:DUF3558 domain-containing protein n=1 Tax=Nocardia canadensis TaxID=3065238 RepID=UPI00292CA5D0|nr:DUF3558 domain-containing protein [Nocardia canadensis]
MVEMTVGGHGWKAVGIAALGLVVAGCGGGESGTAAPTTSGVSVAASPTSVDAEAKVWDPCSLPDSAISGVGLNVGSKKKDVAGVDFTGWKVCSWMDPGKQYSLAVLSSEHTLAESRARSDFSEWETLTVGSHAALEFRQSGASHDLSCFVAVEVPNGSVMFRFQNRVSADNPLAPCPEARRLSSGLVQNLPA